MCDNKKKILRLITAIFSVSMIFVILINIYELNMLSRITNDFACICVPMLLKMLLLVISFIAVFRLIVSLFNKEVNYDYMTGLCSRRKLFNDLNELINKKVLFTVCYIDFNDFKYINDNYGHKAGDNLLREFSKRICLLKCQKITGYRIGGDEFVVIINKQSNVENAIQSVRDITIEDVEITHHNSAKIAFAMGVVENDFVSTADELIKKADSMMYKNKKT